MLREKIGGGEDQEEKGRGGEVGKYQSQKLWRTKDLSFMSST